MFHLYQMDVIVVKCHVQYATKMEHFQYKLPKPKYLGGIYSRSIKENKDFINMCLKMDNYQSQFFEKQIDVSDIFKTEDFIVSLLFADEKNLKNGIEWEVRDEDYEAADVIKKILDFRENQEQILDFIYQNKRFTIHKILENETTTS